MMTGNLRSFILLLGIVLVLVAVFFFAARIYMARIYHFIEVDPGKLYRDGLKSKAQFLASCERGQIKTVVSLVGNDEVGNERFGPVLAACRERGIQLRHVPIHISSWPMSADIQEFLKIATEPSCQPVLTHCREGIRRTGMMTAAYQMSALGYSREQATAAIQAFGHSQRTIADIQKFIELYDPITRTISYPTSTLATQPAEE